MNYGLTVGTGLTILMCLMVVYLIAAETYYRLRKHRLRFRKSAMQHRGKMYRRPDGGLTQVNRISGNVDGTSLSHSDD